jgi:hypothetical protein
VSLRLTSLYSGPASGTPGAWASRGSSGIVAGAVVAARGCADFPV